MPHPPFLCQLVYLLVPNTTQHSTIQLKPKQRPTIGVPMLIILEHAPGTRGFLNCP